MNAYVLAGGASRRMGTDKARLPQHGWPMAVWLLGLLEEAGHDAFLVRRGAPDGLPWVRPDGRPVEVVREPEQGDRHPLWGVATALRHANGPVIIVPCDVPAMTVAVVEALAQPGVAVGERRHPLVAHVPLELLESVEEGAREGVSAGAVLSTLPDIPVDANALRDRNTAAEWRDPMQETLGFMRGEVWATAFRGERERRRARGILVPEPPSARR